MKKLIFWFGNLIYTFINCFTISTDLIVLNAPEAGISVSYLSQFVADHNLIILSLSTILCLIFNYLWSKDYSPHISIWKIVLKALLFNPFFILILLTSFYV